ncbi:PIN/TRAM domain-containing protein [Microaerobacter geothermalis]|uniref:PIN/TRAM domain-containing protein n=1 Tax=Microaerobacter geothermalis TaxID=674972 RepID=UPI001F297E8A|nr:PIN/TRAM domain-containing protein [Microaerobacter geothermalis]MCF6095184.1 PIN/TRAM domain-containing protein [Microaerobacter geothermalis]
MLKKIVQLFFLLTGAGLGYQFGPDLFLLLNPIMNIGEFQGSQYVGALIGAILFLVLTAWLVDIVVNAIRWGEDLLVKLPVTDVLFGAIGLIIGLIVAFLLFLPINNIPLWIIGDFLPLFVSVLLGYLGFQVGFKKKEEILSLFSLGRSNKDKLGKKGVRDTGEPKILDTSVIIDGRIADICKTGFIEGALIIPTFVLEELQHIADSSDVLKRNRGRRGLDILNKIQKELPIDVQIYEGDFEEIQEVDSKLVKLAKILSGKVITNDFNLNKVCELQGVPVLNINDLANAVKPVVLPGEELNIQIIKDGKEHGQGVAYLDDGTMIVVEGGREFIGSQVDVLVTSVLQTSAGRMIFAKPKILEKAL